MKKIPNIIIYIVISNNIINVNMMIEDSKLGYRKHVLD